jgi:hypothetical protein
LNREKIWKIWKKSRLNSEMIWKIWKKDKLKCEKIWKILKKSQIYMHADLNFKLVRIIYTLREKKKWM